MENSYYDLEKARVVKYIKRIPKPSGKGYYYFYTKEQLKAYYEKGIVPEGQTKEEEPVKQSPFASIMDFFGLGSPKEAQQKIKAEYETNQIKSIFDISVYMFSDYMNAYFKHKEKFDAFFRAKEKTGSGAGSGLASGKGSAAAGDKKPDTKVTAKTITVDGQTYQLDVMKFISQKYGSMKKEKQSGKNRPDVRPGSVSADSAPVQPGAAEGYVAGDVQERQPTSDSRQSVFPSSGTGVGPAEYVPDRVSKKTAKDIRQACLDLLASKTDDQMTDEDKALLRQYEGAGGLHEENSSTHGTLYEFYTPTAVVNKMWDIVRKYISGWNKPNNELSVLEPSAGTGRFMEAGNYQYDAIEIDETSARINKILHPEASVIQGGFQEMFFKDGVLQREYNGKKYDVVIGNPPYGSYEGIYKGRGEGKDHSRYEEYFIDRGLDTLKDGGIMAFIVPSGFLRSGKNSSIKEKIAKKGRLMEAWRLPNGTFSSTGVGTDVLIIRKEKGNINDFLMDGFFKDNPDNVLGEEVMKSGRFGQEKYIQLKPGESFDQAIQSIDTVKHEVVAPQELPMTEQQKRNLSTAMKGNKNAKKDGPLAEKKPGDSALGSKKETQTAEQFNAQYNMSFKAYELDAWKNTNFDGSLNIDGIPSKSLEQLRKDGDIFYMNGKYFHKTNYLSGNIYKKLDALEADRAAGKIADAEYKRQKKELESKIPSPKTVKNISVSPLSQFAKDFYFPGDIDDMEDQEIIPIPPELDDFAEIARAGTWKESKELARRAKLSKDIIDIYQETYGFGDEGWKKFVSAAKRTRGSLSSSLMDRFWEWAGGNQSGGKYRQTFDAGVSKGDLPLNAGWSDIVDYIEGVPTRTKANASDAEKDRTQRIREERRAAAEKIFNKFIQTGLTESERKYFEGEWNRIFNANVDPDFKKVPVFLDGISKTFKDKPLEVKDIQLKGISFLGNKGNGLLAYEVGVGKTLTGILATVQQLQLGRAKRPLICVPKGVYKNWIKEIQDLFPDIKINALGNLGKDSESSIKMVDGKPVIEDGALNIVTYEALANLTFKDDTINSGLLNDIVESQETEGEGDSDRDRAKKKEKIMTKLGAATDVKSKAYYIEDFGFDHITVDEVHNFKNIFTAPTPPKGGRMRGGFEDKNDTNKKQANEFQGIGAGSESKRGLKMFAVAQYIQSVSNGRNVFALSATPFQNSPVEIYNILSLVARDRLKDLGIFNMYEFMAQFAELKSEWAVTAKGQIERKQVMKEFKNLSALQNLITEYIDKVDGVEAGVKRPEKTTHLVQLPMNDVQKAIMAAETLRMESAKQDNPGAVLKGINNCRQSTISPAEIKEDELHSGIDIRKMRYVEDSPKLTFTFDSVTAIHKDAPSVGQVVYMPRGVTNYDKCVDYLVKKGIPKDAIATISAGVALDKREAIMESFNDPRGKIKVIIGSESIQEGVNLNGNSAILYNTLLDWNPTESLQVEGRIWRQGNKQSNVHIVYPLLADSIDSSMYQKHDEKSKRLASLFSYKGDTLNVEGINAEEVKFDLIKNPEKRAKFQIDLEKESAQNRVRDYQLSIENLQKMERDYHGAATSNQDYYRERIAETEAELAEMKADINAAKKEVEEATGDYDKRLANIKLDREESSYRYKQSKAAEFKKELNRAIELKARIEFNLSQMGLNVDGVPAEVEKRKAEMAQIQQEIKDIEAKMPEYIEAAKRDIIEKASMRVPTVSESVKNFVQSVSGTIIKKVEDLEKSFTIRNGKVLIRKFNPETARYEYIRG